MNPQLIRLAQRLVANMLTLCGVDPHMKNRDDFNRFAGLGLALAFIYEEATEQSAAGKHPRELIQWAMSFPIAPGGPREKLMIVPQGPMEPGSGRSD